VSIWDDYQEVYDPPDIEAQGPSLEEIEAGVIAPTSLREPAGSWRTRDGRVLRIFEMSRPHIENAIRLFERAGWAEHPKIRELREELARRDR
jgi:hypothetical protein